MIFVHMLSCIIISLLQEGKEIIFGEPYYTDKFQGTKRRLKHMINFIICIIIGIIGTSGSE